MKMHSRTGQGLIAALRAIIERPDFVGTRFGIDIRDMHGSEPLYQHHAHEMFPGASTTKILTALCALALLGPEFRFHTKLVRSGNVDGEGTLHGDLILIASGDPNLSGRVTQQDTLDFTNLDHSNTGAIAELVKGPPLTVVHSLASGAYASGIRRITGTVLVDVSVFAEGYRETGTFTTVSPVSVNDNQIDIEVIAGANPGDPLRYNMSPNCGYVRFVDRATTGEKQSEPMLLFSNEQRESDGTWSVVVSGTAPAGRRSMAKFAVESPSRFARVLLVEALASVGIVVEGGLFGANVTPNPTSGNATTVAEHVSPPMIETTKVMLKVSQNLHAEMLIPTIGASLRGARGADASVHGYACCANLFAEWELDMTGAFQGDACGAFGYFSPDFMGRLLTKVASSNVYDALVFGLPVLGRDGTLWDIQTRSPAAGQVRAKTGTFSFNDPLHQTTLFTCKALAGYLDGKSGRKVAFTIYMNNFLAARNAEINPGQVVGELATAIFEHL